ncbi:MAG: hypothetical protein ACJ703_07985 [Nitrososphaera sp.]|jgi:metal-responsive CopG/Arc/MetJ family transcriptional regulator
MYKTVSITNKTYQELNTLSARLEKPKSQLIAELVRKLHKSMEGQEKQKLDAFNAKMQTLIAHIQLPRGTKVSTENIDEDFRVLKDTPGVF